jgi:hypothetical protein
MSLGASGLVGLVVRPAAFKVFANSSENLRA